MISSTSKRRLQIQGYCDYSDRELSQHRFGIRFAYGLCTSLALAGLLTKNIPLLSAVALVALMAAISPRHPFDYLYNYAVRHFLSRPKLPPRTVQGRFACGVAFVWLLTIVALLYFGYAYSALVLGGTLVAVGTLVTTTDICIPSMVFNALFRASEERA